MMISVHLRTFRALTLDSRALREQGGVFIVLVTFSIFSVEFWSECRPGVDEGDDIEVSEDKALATMVGTIVLTHCGYDF